MAVPKKKTSVSRKGLRRAGQHHKLYAKSVVKCATTGEFALPHRVSPAGWYKGVKVFETRAEKTARLEEEAGETAE
jgi:large subunit ribosomal protein L32